MKSRDMHSNAIGTYLEQNLHRGIAKFVRWATGEFISVRVVLSQRCCWHGARRVNDPDTFTSSTTRVPNSMPN